MGRKSIAKRARYTPADGLHPQLVRAESIANANTARCASGRRAHAVWRLGQVIASQDRVHQSRAHQAVSVEALPTASLAPPAPGRAVRWVSWLVGAAALGAVISVALHFSESREFVRIAERAHPGWLLAAVALQASTYFAEGQVWRTVARAVQFPLSVRTACRLSVAKLFVDQALPSGGISGTFVVARSLGERGMPRRAVMAGVVIDSASYHAAYVLCLGLALLISLVHQRISPLLEAASAAFTLFALSVASVELLMSGRSTGALGRKLARLPVLHGALAFLEDADPALARNPRLLLRSASYQLAIFLLDAATIWLLIEGLGSSASAPSVFASFMFSNLFRSIGILPGGLGTFEATSVFTLKMIGVDFAVALSATLLFRGLSFWLPMLPGLWFSRGAVAQPNPSSQPITPRADGAADRAPPPPQ
jgi:uncharacterized protein (TIRG00374 family)